MKPPKRKPAKHTNKGNKRRKKSFFKGILKFFLWAIIILIMGSIFQVLILKWAPPFFSSFMAIRKVELIVKGAPATIHYKWRPYEQISPEFALAVVAAEDQKFPHHSGFDIKAIEKAIEDNKRKAKIRGGSTISQQVAKNLFCWPRQSYFRKAVESYYTLLIEFFWNKKRVLEVYMNVAELGPGIYGAEAASIYYFKKPASDISRNEAAVLAAVLPSPRKYSVQKPSPYVQGRAEWIKKQMNQLGGKKYLEIIQ